MLAVKIAAIAAIILIAVAATIIIAAIVGVWHAGEDMGIWDEWD